MRFLLRDAVAAYESVQCGFIIVARKTARRVEQVKAAEWQRSPRTDAAGECEFWYQPDGWGKRTGSWRYVTRSRRRLVWRTRGAIPMVRDPAVHLPGVCDEYGWARAHPGAEHQRRY